ncbi:MAG: BolA family transcriptional regulator [Candidatus Schekmanbacteria bacterium]|nr:BolA family transcriptional regulator [Candidatus Schekmanbacteria bacterium]
MNRLSCDDVRALIENAIPNARVDVADMTGTSDHFRLRVEAATFAGKSLLDQHRMVQKALGIHLAREIHAVEIKTVVAPPAPQTLAPRDAEPREQ